MAVGHTLSVVREWLRGVACPIRRELDLTRVDHLLRVLTSFLGAKASLLSQQELRHLATLLVKVCACACLLKVLLV